MSTSYELLKWLHILLFGMWLGSDSGLFVTSRFIMRPDLPMATRGVLARLMVIFDLGPKVCLILILPAGVSLATELGIITPRWIDLAVWIVTVNWLMLLWALHLYEGEPIHKRLANLDIGWRVLLALSILGLAGARIAADAGPIGADYVAWKLAAFATIILLGVAIRFRLRPFGAAFTDIAVNGSTPEREATLRRTLYVTYPLVFGIWILVLTAGWLGVSKPG